MLISPGKCRELDQTRHNIYVLHNKINELNTRFNYVPDHARLLFNEYHVIQERMIFENYKKDYLPNIC